MSKKMGDSANRHPFKGNCAGENCTAMAARNQTAIGDFRDLLQKKHIQ